MPASLLNYNFVSYNILCKIAIIAIVNKKHVLYFLASVMAVQFVVIIGVYMAADFTFASLCYVTSIPEAAILFLLLCEGTHLHRRFCCLQCKRIHPIVA